MNFSPILLSLLLFFNTTGEKSGVFVLGYHGFSSDNDRYSVQLKDLESHLKFIKARGFRFVNFSDIDNGNITGTNNVLVTIDGGRRDIYNAYYKVFKPLNIKPLLAVYIGVINKKSALSWKQLKELSDEGCEIASHGYYHRFLNEKLFKRERKSFLREIYKSKSVLEKNLNKEIDVFVYPYGVKSGSAIKELKKAGYRYAFTTENSVMDLSSLKGNSIYQLPRYVITRGSWGYISKKIAKFSKGKVSLVAAVKKPVFKKIKEMKYVSLASPSVEKEKTGLKNYNPVEYRDYKSEDKVHLINLDIKDRLIEPDIKGADYSLNDYLSFVKKKYIENVKPIKSDENFVISSNSKMFAYNSSIAGNLLINTGYKITGTNNESRVIKLKRSYYKISHNSYNIYSKWINLIKKKIDEIGKKISVLINSVFSDSPK